MTTSAFSQKPTLIGRQREVSLLWQRYEGATTGQVTVTLVGSEAGIGKSRLLDEMAMQAVAAGARALRGAATEAEGMPPYLPFIEALGQYIRTADMEVLRAQTTTTAPILAALLPELRLRLSETSASWRLPPEQARLRLYEAIGELLAAIANERPLLLLLDDLHWADPATLDLLCFIVAHQRAARLMALCAYREGEATHPQALERAFATLHRLRVVSGITLTALSPVDVGCLAQGHLGGALEPAASRFLARQSEGNPFFVEELLRSWIESGLLAPGGLARDGSNGWSVANASGIDLPAGILTTIRQRLIRLPTDTLDVLRIAAIVGRAFDVALLAEITGDAPEILEERLAAASRAQLIRTGPAGTFTFAHDKIRECLYAEVTAARRTRLHTHIGRSLEAGANPPDTRRIADLAFHFTHSGDRERGVKYAEQAAEAAMAVSAFEDAMAHYRDALDLLDGADERRAAMLLALGETAVLAGSEREALSIFALAQTSLQSSGHMAAAARASYGLVRANDMEAGVPLLEHALALAENTRNPVEAVECCACLTVAYMWRGDFDRMEALNNTQVEYAHASHDLHQLRHAYTMKVILHTFEGQLREADEILAEAEQIVLRLTDPEPLAFLRFIQGGVAYHRGDYVQAELRFESACRLFRAIGPDALIWYLGWLGLTYTQRGNVEAARVCIAELETLIATIPPGSAPIMEALVPMAQTSVVLADHTLAARIYPQLLLFRTRQLDFVPERLLGEMATLLRQWDTADAHLTAAKSMTCAPDGAPGRARAPELARHGRSAQTHARQLLCEALSLMKQVGMEGEAQRIREQLDMLPEERMKQSFPDHLTRREVEVLRLIATGASNHDIAAALVLSVRTVERHISNIYGKIGVEGSASRAAATTYAMRHGLV